jgi:hypothetical protein
MPKTINRVGTYYKLITMKQNSVEIPALKIDVAEFEIKGTAPLIVHRFGEKAIKMIVDKQTKKSKERPERNPDSEMGECLYKFNDGVRTGFPAVGFKAAMIRGGSILGWVMKELQQIIFVVPDENDLVEIKGKYALRTDMVRVGMGSADIRYRPEYKEWSAKLVIRYNSSKISAEQIAQLIDAAGFGCGIGEWRPEKSKTGNFGTWKLSEQN